MDQETICMLEYGKVKERLAEFAVSDLVKRKIMELAPLTNHLVIAAQLAETTEARAIVDKSSSVPIHSLTGIEEIMNKLGRGFILNPEELTHINNLLQEVQRLKRFMKDKELLAPTISRYVLVFDELDDLKEEIARSIYGGRVDDKASPDLAKIRKKIIVLEERIKSKLDSIIKSPAFKAYLQENLVTMRQGRYVIPVKSEYRRNINGEFMDASASGSTVFVEPAEVRKMQDALNVLRFQEEKEVDRVLMVLTGMVEGYQRELSINIETMAQIDFAFAKAKYSRAIGGRTVNVTTDGRTKIIEGKHPLLGNKAVPLNFSIGGNYRALVITGPNTGGKTVALKTIGLLTIMVQSGLHVPVEGGSSFTVYHDVLADIGDGQSLEQSLSTFSSHIRRLTSILRQANSKTLIILDEIGAGTDPQEGAALAIAILEKIYQAGAVLLATTHYSEIKAFATTQSGFTVGCMEFDINTLQPLYRMRIGQAGESNALLIALRLGLDKELIERAHKLAYHEQKEYTATAVATPELTQGELQQDKESQHFQQHVTIDAINNNNKAAKSAQNNIKYKVGDAVYISSMGCTGIVYEQANGRGEVGVLIKKQKFKINHKRLSLNIDAAELYPENYDMSIVLDSKDNRKKRKLMSKRHVEGVTINITE